MTEKAIGKVMEEEDTNTTTTTTKHFSEAELESSEEEGNATDDEAEEGEGEEIERSRGSKKEIIKELKNIQRQNTITHYLLTVSILVTLAWQLSEFSLILRIKQGVNNPLKSIGGAIRGLFTTRIQNNDQKQVQVIPPTYLPGLKIPDWPGFDTSASTSTEEDDD